MHPSKWLRPAGYAGVLVLVLLFPGVAKHQLGVIVEGHVICGFPERPGALEHFRGATILDAQAYLFHEPAYASGLFLRRTGSLFTLTRPYFSVWHNLFLTPFYTLFALALAGWWWGRSHRVVQLMSAVVTLNALLIGLTYDEWNGRFLVPLWPILIGWAAIGLGELIRLLGGSAGRLG